VRLYLSSFGLGDHPDQLLTLLHGGKRAAVVLNAKDGSSAESRARSLTEEMDALSRLGLEPRELDLRDHSEESLRETLSEIDLLWVRGGNVFELRRAMRASGFDAVLPGLLAQDAIVYGGFSAAVCVLGPSLRGFEIADAPGADPVWEGLGVLPYAVAPHYRSDHPESDAVDRLVQHFIDQKVLFKALRDGEAIVVD